MTRVLIIIVISALAILPRVAFAHSGTEVSVKGEVRVDGAIEIVGTEFAANDTVRVELRRKGSAPIELGRIPADADGNVAATLHVPASAMAGLYQLAADGEESATAEVTVLAPASASTGAAPQPAAGKTVENDRPAGETVGLAVFTAVVALVAIGLLWISRTHAHPAGAGRHGGLT